jgi:hypothetical protein
LRKEPIAILHHIHDVQSAASIAVDQVGNATVPLLGKLKPVDNWCVVGEGAVVLENPHYMIGHVSYVDIELLRLFAVFSRTFEGNLLFLLGDRITRWKRNRQAQQRHGGETERVTSVHDFPPPVNYTHRKRVVHTTESSDDECTNHEWN